MIEVTTRGVPYQFQPMLKQEPCRSSAGFPVWWVKYCLTTGNKL
jgi:hypothetical protein